MRHFAVSVSILAPPERIWAVLTDAAGYTRWNNTVERVRGKVAPGETLTVYAKVSPGRAFPVKVVDFQPPHRMVWAGGMPLGLFQGKRTFTLEPDADRGVQFSMREEYTGILAPLVVRSIPDLQPAVDEFANDLKRAAEAQQEGK